MSYPSPRLLIWTVTFPLLTPVVCDLTLWHPQDVLLCWAEPTKHTHFL